MGTSKISKKELIFLVLCMILVITFAFVVLVVYFTALQPIEISIRSTTSENLSSTSENLSSTSENSSSTSTNSTSTYTAVITKEEGKN